MSYDGLNKYMEAATELGRNPVSKHEIQPEYGVEQADAGRDCRTRLARPNSQAQTGTGKDPMAYGGLNQLMDAAAELGIMP